MPFKVGDRVKFTQTRIDEFSGHSNYGVESGQVYTVVAVESSNFVLHTGTLKYTKDFRSHSKSLILVKKPVILIKRKK